MNSQRLLFFSFTLVVCAAIAIAFPSFAQVNNRPDDPKAVALNLVAKRTGNKVEQLEVINSASPYLPLIGKRLNTFKVRNKTDQQVYLITVDEKGDEVDLDLLLAEERAAHAAKYGKLQPELAERLKTASPDELIKVIIHLHEPPDTADRPQLPLMNRPVPDNPNEQERKAIEGEQEEFQKKMTAYQAARARLITTPVLERLAKMGYDAKSNELFPMIHVELRPEALKEVEGWKEVKEIVLSFSLKKGSSVKPLALPLDVSLSTIGANLVHSRGINGSGVRLGMVDIPSVVSSNNPYLSLLDVDPQYACGSNEHSTLVAGVMASTHGTYRGIAPGVHLWTGSSCTGNVSEVTTLATRAVTFGAKAINFSGGEHLNRRVSTLDSFVDRLVWDNRVSVVALAGNEADTCETMTGDVLSPGTAYNVITVGAFNDQNTGTWDDDTMWQCSSYVNPISFNSDREKPEVAAPGRRINTLTNVSPWAPKNETGTSLSAPHVTGTIGLLVQRQSVLGTKPEAVKAIIMASAAHNIEGGRRLSAKDGVGGISASWADDVARRVMGSWGETLYNCTFPNPYNVVNLINLTANLQTRIVIVWSNSPDYTNYSTTTGVDLELEILGPSGQMWTSTSLDNPFEIVDFFPPVTGTYQLRVRRLRCDFTPPIVAWAYWQFH